MYPRPRGGRQDQPAFKVKSILKGSETFCPYNHLPFDIESHHLPVSRLELVGWLQHEIAEQKRIDVATSGAPIISDSITLPTKDASVSSDVQMLLPTDVKRHRKHSKQIFLDRGKSADLFDEFPLIVLTAAFATGAEIKSSFQTGLPTLAVDISDLSFESMTKNSNWITDEGSWKTLLSTFEVHHTAYAHQIREAAAKRKVEGHRYILLYAVREERVQLITLS